MAQRTSADSGLLTLFVCTGNFYRSRHAEALFNWHATRAGHPARAFSRGLLTSLVADEPTLLRREDLERAHRTIALKKDEHHAMMLQSHPEWADRIEYWSVHDIDCAHPDQALPQIEEQVLELMRTLRI
jgi:protein-tyrosine phosphatase